MNCPNPPIPTSDWSVRLMEKIPQKNATGSRFPVPVVLWCALSLKAFAPRVTWTALIKRRAKVRTLNKRIFDFLIYELWNRNVRVHWLLHKNGTDEGKILDLYFSNRSKPDKRFFFLKGSSASAHLKFQLLSCPEPTPPPSLFFTMCKIHDTRWTMGSTHDELKLNLTSCREFFLQLSLKCSALQSILFV